MTQGDQWTKSTVLYISVNNVYSSIEKDFSLYDL